MGRVNVFLKDELLDEINEEVKDEGTSRSALIQEALEEKKKKILEERKAKLDARKKAKDSLAGKKNN